MPLQKLSDLSPSEALFVNLTMPPLDELRYLLVSVVSLIAGLAVFSRPEGKSAGEL
jgi:hypothetical protein